MEFSQGQLREVLGVSVETFRHWKRVLPPFVERRPYTGDYSIGDVIAAGVIHWLTARCGIRAGQLADIADEIVEVCNANAWAKLEAHFLLIDIAGKGCRLVGTPREAQFDSFLIVCPLHLVLTSIREGISRLRPSNTQRQFNFLPVTLAEPNLRGRRA